MCTRVFDRKDMNTMKFDDFIQCCVMLKSLTESFKRLDTNRSGVITINYETVHCSELTEPIIVLLIGGNKINLVPNLHIGQR
jgi:Ca2+-binding EF-hand superfamily protein